MASSLQSLVTSTHSSCYFIIETLLPTGSAPYADFRLPESAAGRLPIHLYGLRSQHYVARQLPHLHLDWTRPATACHFASITISILMTLHPGRRMISEQLVLPLFCPDMGTRARAYHANLYLQYQTIDLPLCILRSERPLMSFKDSHRTSQGL